MGPACQRRKLAAVAHVRWWADLGRSKGSISGLGRLGPEALRNLHYWASLVLVCPIDFWFSSLQQARGMPFSSWLSMSLRKKFKNKLRCCFIKKYFEFLMTNFMFFLFFQFLLCLVSPVNLWIENLNFRHDFLYLWLQKKGRKEKQMTNVKNLTSTDHHFSLSLRALIRLVPKQDTLCCHQKARDIASSCTCYHSCIFAKEFIPSNSVQKYAV